MSYAERHIIETYSKLFSGLSSGGKRELIENLSNSIKDDVKDQDIEFFNSFGSFGSQKTAEDIISEIKTARKFNRSNITL